MRYLHMHMCEGALASGLWVYVTVEAFNVHTLSEMLWLMHWHTYTTMWRTHVMIFGTEPDRERGGRGGWMRKEEYRKERWGGGLPNSRFLSLIHSFSPFLLVSLTVSQKHRESVLMVCQIMLFSPTVDWWCSVCVSCVCACLDLCVCGCVF